MSLFKIMVSLGLLCFSTPEFLASLSAQNFEEFRRQVEELGELTEPPKTYVAEGFESDVRLSAIFYEGLSWQGRATRVFAWLGFPSETNATPESQDAPKRFPAIVLVHGGGGTAFKEWVKLWNDRGYVAISIAVEGQTDQRRGNGMRGWISHEWKGPHRIGIYQDTEAPLKDQWMYHAVADTILAHSLLANLPQVDPERIGLMGISWGGVIASTVAGIDQRFNFIIPTYGCGGLENADNQWGRALGTNRMYQNVWDPLLRLPRAQMPILWLSWTGDTHFPMDCLARSCEAANGPHLLTLVPEMGHGHAAGWIRPESYAFADSVTQAGEIWLKQESLRLEQQTLNAVFSITRSVDDVLLYSTRSAGESPNRRWTVKSLSWNQDGDRISIRGELPEETRAFFINLKSGKLYGSSDYQHAR